MFGFVFQIFIFLLGVIALLIAANLVINRDRWRWVALSLVIGLIFIVTSTLLDRSKSYQCKYVIPDQIKIAGHVRDKYNGAFVNNYMVLLFRDNAQVAKAVTFRGKFDGGGKDEENNGFFEFDIQNKDQLTRCSMEGGFQQTSSKPNFLGFGSLRPYLWRNLADLGSGAAFHLTKNGQEHKYTLVVSPGSVATYPKEINFYPAYLDPDDKVAINLPIKTYTPPGNQTRETGFFVQDYPEANTLLGLHQAIPFKVLDAWVAKITYQETIGSDVYDDELIDIDNCKNTSSQSLTVPKSITYIQEVQFQDTPDSRNYDLALVALKAAPSLGFKHGQLFTEEYSIPIDVPAQAHMKYQVFWREQWKEGVILANQGNANPVSFPYRARKYMLPYTMPYQVACP
ncbi:MAG: hypothetical protein ACM3XO_22560 [Bacteroidota bacterium]